MSTYLSVLKSFVLKIPRMVTVCWVKLTNTKEELALINDISYRF